MYCKAVYSKVMVSQSYAEVESRSVTLWWSKFPFGQSRVI